MKDILKAKEIFLLDEIEDNLHFDSIAFEVAKNELIDAIKAKENPMIFLVGDPGCGKSYLLRYLQKKEKDLNIVKYFTYPFFDEKEFLEILFSLIDKNEQKRLNIEEITLHLKKKFNNLEHVIIIDEAQHLTEELVELIRILSDQGIFQFVLSLHKKEAEYVLSKPQYKTRNPKKVMLDYLNDEEVLRYIQNMLLNHNLSHFAINFKKSYIKMIREYTNKNFRAIKKFLATLFSILLEANKRNLNKYSKINKHTIIMSAIDTGMIDVK